MSVHRLVGYVTVPDPDLEIGRGGKGRSPKTFFFGPLGLSLVKRE